MSSSDVTVVGITKAEAGEYVLKHCRWNILEGSDISYVEAARNKVKKSAN